MFSSCDFITLSQLFDIEPQSENFLHESAQLFVEDTRRDGRWLVQTPELWQNPGGWRLRARENVGDAPGQYHPLFVLAILSSRSRADEATSLPDWPVPRIAFSTEESVLRSMTLNGMRMSTEYFASGSLRVLDLVENRLKPGQRDVVHNVLVYLARQIVDARARMQEERDLRAESVAAYLGLDFEATRDIFRGGEWNVDVLAEKIESGAAGKPQRDLDVRALLSGQIEYSHDEMKSLQNHEARWLHLIDEISARLYAYSTAKN
jgi:hypothetical protein